MAKFRVGGDFIRISDQDDPGYRMNHYYKVERVQKTSYVLRSGQHGQQIRQKITKDLVKHLGLKNMMEFIDKSYRLLTDAEKVLYVKDNGRKDI